MPVPSDFDADKLLNMIKQKKTASEIKDELGITQATLNNYLLKFIQQDYEVYVING